METCDRGTKPRRVPYWGGGGGLILGNSSPLLVQFEKSLICMLKFVESTFANCDSLQAEEVAVGWGNSSPMSISVICA